MKKTIIISSIFVCFIVGCKQASKEQDKVGDTETVLANEDEEDAKDDFSFEIEGDTDIEKAAERERTAMRKSNDFTYDLGSYAIKPKKRQVGIYTFSGKATIGYPALVYQQDKTIKYNTTTLFIVGSQIFFRENIRFFPKFDLKTLRVIRNNLNGDLLCRDKNYLYRNAVGSPTTDYRHIKDEYVDTINLSGYTVINDYIYQKDSDLYFLSKPFELKKVEGITLDIPTLKHLAGNYFTDKNGLYLLGQYNDAAENYSKSVQLEYNKGFPITPVVKRNYLIYGGKVYPIAPDTDYNPLPLNTIKMKEIVLDDQYSRFSFLADDNHTFQLDYANGCYTEEIDFADSCFNALLKKNVNQWQVITTAGDVDFIKKDGGKTLYFPSGIKTFGGTFLNTFLIKTPNGFYAKPLHFNLATIQKVKHVFFFNFDTKEYEELDASQYRHVSHEFRIYKNRLYGLDGLPVKEPIETENLRLIMHHDVKTNYLTDGKLLISVKTGYWGGTYIQGKGSNAMRVLDTHIICGVDFSTLKVVTADILIDKNNIYSSTQDDGIQVIPIKSLHFKMRIFTEQ